jgi:hypothetical protein
MLTDDELRELAGESALAKNKCVTIWAKGGLELDAVDDLNKQINAYMNEDYVIQAGSLLHYTSSPYQGSVVHNFIVLMVLQDWR